MDCIHSNLDCELSINILANLGQLSPRQFFRRFPNTFGITPHRYIMEERMAHAKKLLLSGQPLGEIAARRSRVPSGLTIFSFRDADEPVEPSAPEIQHET
jgi:methylphosphotriester-DNA--protein-cysteine methyltransferase